MDEKGASTFPFHNLPPELKNISKAFPLLFYLSFWIKEKSVVTLANRNICEHKRKTSSQFSHRITVENVEPKKATDETSEATLEKEVDDILNIIKMSNYKIVDYLLQTPSKISILALLMNSSAHREYLMRVLE